MKKQVRLEDIVLSDHYEKFVPFDTELNSEYVNLRINGNEAQVKVEELIRALEFIKESR